MGRLLAASAVALAVLLAGGCGSGSDGTATEPAGPTATVPSPETSPADAGDGRGRHQPRDETSAAVPEALRFTGTTVDGQAFQGASLAGRPTLLWFWAPWCPTCRSQIPQVEEIATGHAGELNVVGIGSLDSAEAIAGFADEVGGVTHLEDAEGELWRRFGITEQSSFVLLDTDGSVAFETGYGGSDELGDRVEDVLG